MCKGITIVFTILLAAPCARAQFSIDWYTIDGGGNSSSGGVFSLAGTIGQPDTGAMSDGLFECGGGFWGGGTIAPGCAADVDDGSGTGTPDGGVTIDDLLYYLFIFEVGDIRADIDDGTSTGTPDGGVTIDDLLYYLARFEAGC